MNFVHIYWLYALIPVLLFLWLAFCYNKKIRKQFINTFASPKLVEKLIASYSPKRRFIKIALFALSIILIFITLSRPQWGHKWEEQRAKGIDVIFALDTSKSMLAEDIHPNRLERAKFGILDLLKKLDGDRVGLIAFSGSAFLQCPLTLDYNAFRQSLEAIDTSIIQQGGTDIANAIATSEPSFSKDNNFKFIVLITDGEDLEKAGIAQARIAAKNDVTIYTVGVGTAQGELIPIKKVDGSIDYLRDSKGKVVKTRLDETTLRKIADATGGFYVPLGPTGQGLEHIYKSGLNAIPKQELTSNLKRVPMEQFQWPLSFAILFIVVDSIFSTRSRKKSQRETFLGKNITIILLTGLLFAFSTKSAEASPTKAHKAYEIDDFVKASELYLKATQKNPENKCLNYNLGASYYKANNFEAAGHALHDAIYSKRLEVQENSFYNLGNTHYRIGQVALETNPQQTVEIWEQSLKYYQSAIDLDPEDTDAQENHDFVKEKLEELKKQQQQNEKDQDRKNEPDQQPSSSNQENNQSSGSGNQQQQKPQGNTSNDNKQSPPDNQKFSGKGDSLNNKDPSKGNNDKSSSDKKDSDQENKQSSSQKRKQEPQNKKDQQGQDIPENGRMTPEEARQVLDSMKNVEKKLPVMASRAKYKPKDTSEIKDW